jgi:uncharacterized protein (TIGR03083 family)
MGGDWSEAREAFVEISEVFVDVVRGVPDDAWEAPGLGEWSMRSLAGHGSRALITVQQYLDAGADAATIDSPVTYFVRVMGGGGDQAGIAARGVQAGVALGDDPKGAVLAIRKRVLARLATASDDDIVGLPWGGMTLRQYLPTRVFELTIHTLDIAAALGMADEIALPASAVAVTSELIGLLALAQGQAATFLLAATGRRNLPPAFSVM